MHRIDANTQDGSGARTGLTGQPSETMWYLIYRGLRKDGRLQQVAGHTPGWDGLESGWDGTERGASDG